MLSFLSPERAGHRRAGGVGESNHLSQEGIQSGHERLPVAECRPAINDYSRLRLRLGDALRLAREVSLTVT